MGSFKFIDYQKIALVTSHKQGLNSLGFSFFFIFMCHLFFFYLLFFLSVILKLNSHYFYFHRHYFICFKGFFLHLLTCFVFIKLDQVNLI
jgi:hypothetical protein